MLIRMSQEQTEFTLKLGVLLGIVFVLIYLPLSYLLRQITLKTIKTELESNEFIESEGKVKLWELLVPFGTGGFLGACIFPFILYPNINCISGIERQDLWWCYAGEVFGISFAIIIASWKCVFTNKRMINRCLFKILNKLKFFGDEFIKYSEIERIKYDYHIWIKVLYLVLKNKRYYRIPLFKNMKEVQSTIEKYIGGN
jgi:hypothetical protein